MIDVCLCYALTEDGYAPCPTVDNRRMGPCMYSHIQDKQKGWAKEYEKKKGTI